MSLTFYTVADFKDEARSYCFFFCVLFTRRKSLEADYWIENDFSKHTILAPSYHIVY